jgi:hypothetical protein
VFLEYRFYHKKWCNIFSAQNIVLKSKELHLIFKLTKTALQNGVLSLSKSLIFDQLQHANMFQSQHFTRAPLIFAQKSAQKSAQNSRKYYR